MNKERELLLNCMVQCKSQLISTLSADHVLVNPKSIEASEEARKKGNVLFLQRNKHDAVTHEKIFTYYCESIALAPNKSQELAMAYGNRSYFLLHIHKYEDCIKDIDQALGITTSDLLKAKLLCRKAECLRKLGSSNFSSTLEIAQTCIDKTFDQDRIKLVQMVEAVKKSNKVDINNKQEIIQEHPVTDDYSRRVSIRYNEKYGRHLVAAKDYEPGDVIFVEKIYASYITSRSNSYCHYCLKAVWSSVPCLYCNYTMFCSESCREKAWNNFHDIECALINVISPLWKLFILPLRIWITGIKEFRDISNLKEKLESVDKCTDHSSRGFFENGRFEINSIQNVYSLLADTDSYSIFMTIPSLVPSVLKCLIKYSKLKGEFDIKTVDELMVNEDIIFLGSLLIRIFGVLSLNAFAYNTSTIDVDKLELSPIKQDTNVDSLSRQFITTLSSLFNHSCFPTAGWLYTEHNTFLVYALQPIKKNSQIFISYGSLFYDLQQTARRAFLCKYNFVCECQACVEEWQPIILLTNQQKLVDNSDFDDPNKIIFAREILQMMDKVHEEGQINRKQLKKLSSSIVKAQAWKQPSLPYCDLLVLLKLAIQFNYAPRPPSFEQCN